MNDAAIINPGIQRIKSIYRFRLFELGFNKNKTYFEKTACSVLKTVRGIKRKISSKVNQSAKQPKTIYGFYPLDTRVDDCGIIHLPWYDPRRWSTLKLNVDPASDKYQVKINGHDCHRIKCENGHLSVQLPDLDTVHREISICLEKTPQWRLLEFGCEFEIETNAKD